MIKFHTAKELLKAASKAGFTIKVWGEDDEEPDYSGTNARAAWDAVSDQDEAQITLHNPDGSRVPGGWAHLMVDSQFTCDPQETVVDCSAEGWINDWWEANRNAILA